jgi:hypothetical protein
MARVIAAEILARIPDQASQPCRNAAWQQFKTELTKGTKGTPGATTWHTWRAWAHLAHLHLGTPGATVVTALVTALRAKGSSFAVLRASAQAARGPVDTSPHVPRWTRPPLTSRRSAAPDTPAHAQSRRLLPLVPAPPPSPRAGPGPAPDAGPQHSRPDAAARSAAGSAAAGASTAI